MINLYRNQVVFGTGDVSINIGGTAGTGLLVLRNTDPQEIGKFNPSSGSDEVLRIEQGDFLIAFTNRESVDAVITSLQMIKQVAFNV